MKRFTETTKWDDPWFHDLSANAKLLWIWLTDKCDAAGVIEVSFSIASFQTGTQMSIDTLSELGDRVEKLPCGKYWIRAFIQFQVGTPSVDCKAHNPIFQSIKKHKMERVWKGYQVGIDTSQDQDTDQDEDTVRGRSAEEGEPPTVEQAVNYATGSPQPISSECAEAWHDDRKRAQWRYPKGGRLYPLRLDAATWQSDLRSFARSWKSVNDERKQNNGTRTTQPRRRDNATLNAADRYDH